MAEQFYTIATKKGKAKIANATAFGTKINFAYLALGDGGGSYYNPVDTQEELKNEVWRGPIGSIKTDPENPNWIIVEAIVLADQGGFTIREGGIYDTDGDLLAIAKYPETYKPVMASGSAKDIKIRMVIEVSNTSVVNLKVDPTIILATKKDLEEATQVIQKTTQELDEKINNLKEDSDNHKKTNMPHLFINHETGKTYRYGYQISKEGRPQLIYEEVI